MKPSEVGRWILSAIVASCVSACHPRHDGSGGDAGRDAEAESGGSAGSSGGTAGSNGGDAQHGEGGVGTRSDSGLGGAAPVGGSAGACAGTTDCGGEAGSKSGGAPGSGGAPSSGGTSSEGGVAGAVSVGGSTAIVDAGADADAASRDGAGGTDHPDAGGKDGDIEPDGSSSGGNSHCLTTRDCADGLVCTGTRATLCARPECLLDRDCPSDNHCVANECVLLPGLGESCSASCRTGFHCSSGVCKQDSPTQTCPMGDECGENYYCASGVCFFDGLLGICNRCPPETYCEFVNFSYGCSQRSGLGELCFPSSQPCLAGLYCNQDESLCRRERQPGENCIQPADASFATADHLCDETISYCDPVTNVCVALGGPGEACGHGCRSDLACVNAFPDGVCRPAIACQASADCPSDLH